VLQLSTLPQRTHDPQCGAKASRGQRPTLQLTLFLLLTSTRKIPRIAMSQHN
jgi:hypothetical protein